MTIPFLTIFVRAPYAGHAGHDISMLRLFLNGGVQ